MTSNRRYEVTDSELNRIKNLFPEEKTGRRGRQLKDTRMVFNGVIWLARSGGIYQNAVDPTKSYTVAFVPDEADDFYMKFFLPLMKRQILKTFR